MAKVKGSEASARLMPKSVWIAGSATMNDHMPTPPMVLSAMAMASRSQAAPESVTTAGAVGEFVTVFDPAWSVRSDVALRRRASQRLPRRRRPSRALAAPAYCGAQRESRP